MGSRVSVFCEPPQVARFSNLTSCKAIIGSNESVILNRIRSELTHELELELELESNALKSTFEFVSRRIALQVKKSWRQISKGKDKVIHGIG